VPTVVLVILKYVFLAVLYIFVWRVARWIYVELRPAAPARGSSRGATRPAPAPSKRGKQTPRKMVVIDGDQLKGKSFTLDDEIIIGRADRCHIVLDDSYVSQIHARVFAKGDVFMVEDMGSTNGTYINRNRVTSPTEVLRGDRLKIGKTVLEMRK
jgi:pSer/pThr/pTyr-binding forkhead associated (FHA) protein